jgi:hypothetical protein
MNLAITAKRRDTLYDQIPRLVRPWARRKPDERLSQCGKRPASRTVWPEGGSSIGSVDDRRRLPHAGPDRRPPPRRTRRRTLIGLRSLPPDSVFDRIGRRVSG